MNGIKFELIVKTKTIPSREINRRIIILEKKGKFLVEAGNRLRKLSFLAKTFEATAKTNSGNCIYTLGEQL